MNETIKALTEKIKNPKILVIVGIAGMLLICLSSFAGKKTDTKAEPDLVGDSITAEEYCNQLEKNITMLVESITGGEAKVVITLESGIKYTYADINETVSEDKNESGRVTTGSELKQSYITVKTADGGEEALLVTTEMPEVRGVAIVCEGGDNEQINEKITNAVTAALNITSKRVYIAGGISNEKR